VKKPRRISGEWRILVAWDMVEVCKKRKGGRKKEEEEKEVPLTTPSK
jgi:hypothetical protein